MAEALLDFSTRSELEKWFAENQWIHVGGIAAKNPKRIYDYAR